VGAFRAHEDEELALPDRLIPAFASTTAIVPAAGRSLAARLPCGNVTRAPWIERVGLRAVVVLEALAGRNPGGEREVFVRGLLPREIEGTAKIA
jgi:hypothetical protein